MEDEPKKIITRVKETVSTWTKEGRSWLKRMKKVNEDSPSLVLKQIVDLPENSDRLLNTNKVYGPHLPDTDDPEVRALRVINQNNVEEELRLTFDMDFEQRFKFIRAKLFNGLPSVRGDSPTEYREEELKRSLSVSKANYASADLVPIFIKEFSQQVDKLVQEVHFSPEATDQARRLVTVIYCLGIPLHPYSDGNGQTLRLLMLSYLKQLAPNSFQGKYFPYKPTNIDDNLEGNITTPILKIFNHARLMGEIVGNGLFSVLDEKRKFALANKWYMEDLYLPKHHPITEQEMQELFPEPNSIAAFWSHFRTLLHYSDKWEEQFAGNHWSQTNTNKLLHYLLRTEVGHVFIKRYVLTPQRLKEEVTKETLPIALTSVMKAFDGVNEEIDGLLEDKTTHLIKFEQAKQQALTNPRRARR